MTSEELETFDRLDAEYKSQKEQAETLKREMRASSIITETSKPDADVYIDRSSSPSRYSVKEQAMGFAGWLQGNTPNANSEFTSHALKQGYNLNAQYMDIPFKFENYKKKWQFGTSAQDETNGLGGYTIQTSVADAVALALKQFGSIRNAAKVITTSNGAALAFPTVDDTGNSAPVVAINTTPNVLEVDFGQVTLNAYKYTSGLIKVPYELSVDSVVDLPALIGELIGIRLARGSEGDFASGNGSSKCTGILASGQASQGKAFASASLPTYAEMLGLFHSVDPAYRASASCAWMMHDTAVSAVQQIVDGNTRPIWNATLVNGLTGDLAETLFGKRVYTNNSLPTVATNSKSMLFGDWSQFVIRSSGGIRVIRNDSVLQLADQIAFVAFERLDSKLVCPSSVNPIVYGQMSPGT